MFKVFLPVYLLNSNETFSINYNMKKKNLFLTRDHNPQEELLLLTLVSLIDTIKHERQASKDAGTHL